MAKKRSTARFLFNTFIFSLMFMATMFTIKPYLGAGPRESEVWEVDRALTFIAPSGIPMAIKIKQKPVMMMVYASWCGYCKQVMPGLTNMVANGQLDGIAPMFLSVDAQRHDLSRYLVYHDYHKVFTPIVVDQGLGKGLQEVLQGMGSQYKGGIPYIAFFDENGKLVDELFGIPDKQEILQIANRLRPKNQGQN